MLHKGYFVLAVQRQYGWGVELHCSRTGCHLEYLLASLYFLVHNFPSIYFLILPIKIVFWRKFKFQKKQLYQGTPVHWVKRNWMMFNEKGSKESERWTHSPEWSPILSRGEDGKVFRRTLTMMITNDVDQWSSTWPTCFNTPFSPLWILLFFIVCSLIVLTCEESQVRGHK